jgi:hypothetical protein
MKVIYGLKENTMRVFEIDKAIAYGSDSLNMYI